jgi:hypothetical protein
MHEHTCIPYKETRTSVGSIDLEYSNTLRYGYYLPLFGFGTSPLLVARFLCPVHLVIGWTNKLRLANGN